MEDKIRELSSDYYKRKQHLLKKRLSIFLVLIFSVTFLIFLSVSEGIALKILLSKNFTFFEISSILILISIFLIAYNIFLSRIYLHICYHFENPKTPSNIIMTLFICAYLLLSYTTSGVKDILALGFSKLCIISLYYHFWRSQIIENRLKKHLSILPANFLLSWRAFFICKWVLIACWLLSSLGFAIALVSFHPIIKLEGWEGIIIMITFYFLFKLFVRNPNAHFQD